MVPELYFEVRSAASHRGCERLDERDNRAVFIAFYTISDNSSNPPGVTSHLGMLFIFIPIINGTSTALHPSEHKFAPTVGNCNFSK